MGAIDEMLPVALMDCIQVMCKTIIYQTKKKTASIQCIKLNFICIKNRLD